MGIRQIRQIKNHAKLTSYTVHKRYNSPTKEEEDAPLRS